MTDLTSCFFCGAVEDLGTYAVPPAAYPAPERADVTLCPDCHEKLGRVLELVVASDAVDTAATGGEGATDPDDESDPIHDQAAVTMPGPGDANAGGDDVDREGTGGDSGDPGGDDGDGGSGGASDGPGPSAGSGSRSGAGTGGEPEHYRTVLRLLENREFPVDRAEMRDLARSAYDVDAGEFDAIVDVAEQRGVIADDGERLRRPT